MAVGVFRLPSMRTRIFETGSFPPLGDRGRCPSLNFLLSRSLQLHGRLELERSVRCVPIQLSREASLAINVKLQPLCDYTGARKGVDGTETKTS